MKKQSRFKTSIATITLLAIAQSHASAHDLTIPHSHGAELDLSAYGLASIFAAMLFFLAASVYRFNREES